MCGIFGMVKHKGRFLAADVKEILPSAMLLTSLRGSHSTGIMSATVPYSGPQKMTATWVKSAGNPYDLSGSREFKDWLEKDLAGLVTMWQHGRHATVGDVNLGNAHPFQHKNIILIHNGTIRSGLDIQKGQTDSEAICHSIQENGIEKTIQSINGAYVLVWLDTNTQTLQFIRNTERPLFRMDCSDESSFFASEESTLVHMFYRNIKYDKAKFTQPYPVTTDTLFTIDLVGDTKIKEESLRRSHFPVTNYDSNADYGNSTKPASKYQAPTSPVIPPESSIKGQEISFILTEKPRRVGKKLIVAEGESFDNGDASLDGIPVIYRYQEKDWDVHEKFDGKLLLGAVLGIEEYRTGNTTRKVLVIRTASITELEFETDLKEVILADESVMDEETFLDAASKTCANCGSHIGLSDAPNCLEKEMTTGPVRLICPDCVKTKAALH